MTDYQDILLNKSVSIGSFLLKVAKNVSETFSPQYP